MNASPFIACTILITALLTATMPAQAQATRTWVSGVGDDANPCSRTAPCKTFAGAISKTASNGIINCIDPGGFGALTITKSITIDCSNVMAGVLASGTNGINVNGAGVVAILRGLDIEGATTGLIGINFVQGSALHVENCRIYGFQSGTAQGIRFVPSTTAQMFVKDTTISNTSRAIFVDPVAGAALVTLQGVYMNNNNEGFRATGLTSGSIFASIFNSHASMNLSNGFVAQSLGPSVVVDIQHSSSVVNNGAGVLADGAAAAISIGSSMVTANTNGFSEVNSGQIKSYGNNSVDNNNTNGAPTPPTLSPM